MITCSCSKCSTYGNAAYCINEIIDKGRSEYEATSKPLFWNNFTVGVVVSVCAIPVIIRIFEAFKTA